MSRILYGFITVLVTYFIYTSIFQEDWVQNTIPPKNLEGIVAYSTPLDRKRLEPILNQPFHYLDEGGQSYVFISQDQKYVLKFFKFHRFQTQWYIPYLPDISFLTQYKEKHITRRTHRLQAVLTGHQIAYENLKEESGLITLQLIPTDQSWPLTVADKKGKKRVIDLGKVAFVLQERGEILSDLFSRLLDQGKQELVRDKVEQIMALYQSEFAKGIVDTDHGVMHNIGFIGSRPIHIDVGNFVYDERMKDPTFHQKELTKVREKMETWIDQK